MMKKPKILLSALLVFTMLFSYVASAAEVFQWIIEPSLTYEFAYDHFDAYSTGYWRLGYDNCNYDIVDSYGEVILEDAADYDYVNAELGYCFDQINESQYQVTNTNGNVLFTSEYELNHTLNENLIQILDPEMMTYGAIDLSGNIAIEPAYNYLRDIDYKGWVEVPGYGDCIFDSNNNAFHDTKYDRIYHNDYMIICNNDENGNSILIDKETGKETPLNGEITFLLGGEEFLYNGVLMNSKGELLTEKTERITDKFEELSMGSEDCATIFNGRAQYLSSNNYIIEVDRYTDNERKYIIDANANIIASDYYDIFEYYPDSYIITTYNDGVRENSIIDSQGNEIFPKTNEYLYQAVGSIVCTLDNNNFWTLYYQDGTPIGTYSDINMDGDYMLLRDLDGKIGFAKVIDLPDIDISDKIVLFVGEKDTYVYGEYRANDVNPLIRNSRTMVPIRAVAEALGADVSWDGDMQMVSITGENKEIDIVIGDSYATVNSEAVVIDSPAFIENGRTYLPVRFVSEALGAKVDWDEKTQAVVIY